MIGLLARHFDVWKAGLSQQLKVKLQSVGEGIAQKATGNLHGIAVVRGAQGGAETVELAFDFGGAAHAGAAVPGGAEETRDTFLALRGAALAAGEQGADGNQRGFAVGLHDQRAATRQGHDGRAVRPPLGAEGRAVWRRGCLRRVVLTGPGEHGVLARQVGVRGHEQGEVGALRIEKRRRGLLQVVVAQRFDGRHVALAVVRVAVDQHVAAQLTGDALVRFAGVHEMADDARFRRRQVVLGDGQRGLAHGLHQSLHHVGHVVGHAGGAEQEDAAVTRRVVVGIHVVGQLAAALEGGVEGGIVARAQQVAEQVERRDLRIGGLDRRQGDFHARQLGPEGEGQNARPQLGGFVGARAGGQQRGRHGAEAVLDGAQHGVGIEVADGHEDHVVGHIPGIEHAQHVVALDGPHGFLETDDRTAVGVRREGEVEQALGDFVIRAVLAAAELLEHHFLFAFQLGGIEEGVQHGVAQHVEAGFPEAAGQGDVIDRFIVIRPGVHRAAGALDEGGDFAVRKAVRALEQHVLEDVRNARHGRLLVGAAEPHPRLQGDDGRAVVFKQYHLQAVIEGLHVGPGCVVQVAIGHGAAACGLHMRGSSWGKVVIVA